MKRTAVGQGVYVDEHGEFWARPWFNRRRTWRKLDSTRKNAAQTEAANLKTTTAEFFTKAADAYLQANCPNRRLEERPAPFCAVEKTRLEKLKEFFGRFRCDEIRLAHCPAYKTWRLRSINRSRGTGERTVDVELNTLSNVLNYCVAIGALELNYIRSGRPQFRKESDVRHCREFAPQNASVINTIAGLFFSQPQSEVMGWLTFFHAFTGCRTSELLRLRLDAKTPYEPGYIETDHLFIRRSKGGINPWVKIFPEFRKMIEAFHCWHHERYPHSPYYFPGRNKTSKPQTLDKKAFAHALGRLHRGALIPKVTPHGLRSFYVTKRRSDGLSDPQIAAEIGDQDVNQISRTYGDRPQNWLGGKKMTWLPKGKKTAWEEVLVHVKWTKTDLQPPRQTSRTH